MHTDKEIIMPFDVVCPTRLSKTDPASTAGQYILFSRSLSQEVIGALDESATDTLEVDPLHT